MTELALDATLPFAFAAVLVTGLVRGFAGFGSGLILTPALAILYPTPIAVVIVVLMDIPALAYLLPRTWRFVDRRVIARLTLGGVVGAPLGVWVLASADPVFMRRAIGVICLVTVALLVSGFRLRTRGSAAGVVGVGALAGGIGGASGIPGPPVVLYFLSGPFRAQEVRANINAFYVFLVAALVASYLWHGLVTREVLVRCAVFIPVYVAAIWCGGQLFGRAPERVFRGVAYCLVALVALGALLR